MRFPSRFFMAIPLTMLVVGPALAAPRDVPHPFILWTKEEAAAIRKRIDTEPWARKQLETDFPAVEDYAKEPPIRNLFRYLVMGDERAAAVEKDTLVEFINHPTLKKDVWDWPWHHADTWQHAIRYDVLQDQLAPGQRRSLLDTFRIFARFAIEEEPLRGFHSYGRHPGEHVLALPLKDERVISTLFATRNGIKEFIDGLRDGQFAPPTLTGHILIWAQGCERLGLDEFGYGYRGPSGGSLRRYVEGLIQMGYPRIDIPDGMPHYGRLSLEGKTRGAFHPDFPRTIFDQPIVQGYLPAFKPGPRRPGRAGKPVEVDGRAYTGGLEPWTAVPSAGIYGGDRGVYRLNTPLVFELAHRKWPDAGFGYFLSQMRPPGAQTFTPSLYFGLRPIDPRTVTAPGVRSIAAEKFGFAMLRAEESPAYWESPAPVAVLTGAGPYGAASGGCLALDELIAFNRPLYTAPLSPTMHGACSWTPSGRAHGTVVVDNLQFETAIDRDQYVRRTRWPEAPGPLPMRSAFDPLVKFASVRCKPTEAERPDATGQTQKVTLQIYPGVDMERAVFLTRQYVVDFFRVASDKPRQYHWLVHAMGQATGDAGSAWTASAELDRDLRDARADDSTCLDAKGKTRFVKGSGAPPTYRFKDERSLTTDGRSWSLAVVQTCPDPEVTRLPAGWFDRRIGVRLTMLGASDTKAYHATPVELTYREPEPRKPDPTRKDPDRKVEELELLPAGGVPGKAPSSSETPSKPELIVNERPLFDPDTGGVSIVAARRCASTVFVALHEPFAKGQWRLDEFRRIAQTDRALGVAVGGRDGSPVNDRVLICLGDRPEQSATLSGNDESFTFSDRAFVRVGLEVVEASGPLTAMRIKVAGQPRLMLNGKPAPAAVAGGYLVFGS